MDVYTNVDILSGFQDDVTLWSVGIVHQAARASNSSRSVDRQRIRPADLWEDMILPYTVERLELCKIRSCHLPAPDLFHVSVQRHDSEIIPASIRVAPIASSTSTEYESPVS